MAKAKAKQKEQKPKENPEEVITKNAAEEEGAVEEQITPEEAEMLATMEAEQSNENNGKDDTLQMQSAEFQNLDPESVNELKNKKLDLLMDLSLPVSIELGRTNLLIKDILNLQRGSIVEFEKLASEPVDILINGKKMAEGEVVVIEKHFGIRITNLIDTSERIKSLGV